MKLFSWMQNSKFHNGNGNTKSNAASSSHHKNPEEFSDWPRGLLATGTFGINDLKENPKSQNVEDYEQSVSQDLAAFTPEEVGMLEKELTKLLSRKPAASKVEGQIANLPLDRFPNCSSGSEVDRRISSTLCSDLIDRDEEEEEEDIDRTIRVILGRCRDACMESNKKAIGKKSISFLLKKMFVCTGGFAAAPSPSLRDTFQETRMEKLLRTMLSKKIYPQNSSRASSMKKYIDDRQTPKKMIGKQDETEEHKNDQGSKWVKTDSEYIVLEI